MPIAPRPRSGRFALELGGAHAGWLSAVEGGDAVGTVVTEPPDANGIRRKHVANVQYSDIACELPGDIGAPLWRALQDMLAGTIVRHAGAVVSYDVGGAELERREFQEALITEVSFPALDAGSKEAVRLKLTLSPELTRRVKGAGGQAPAAAARQTQWLASNFRVTIAGLEKATARISKVAGLTVHRPVAAVDSGPVLVHAKEPASMEIPNVVVALGQAAAQPFWDWHEDFVINANSADGQERTGSIELLGPDRKAVLLRLDLDGLGIFKVALDRVEAGSDAIASVTAAMYCDRLRLGAFAGGP